MKTMNSPAEQIKERLDIVSFLQGYIKLQKAGINYKGACPFHREKTPSFFVSPEKQIWHCFGCGAGGDVFGFVMQFENIEFSEALRILAEKAGVSLEEFRGSSYARVDKDLYGICELAARYYSEVLFSPAGIPALEYLRKRGLTDETIREFRLGYVPSQFELLKKFFLSRRIPLEKGEAAGLFLRKGNDVYDRFRGRIMFPIQDRLGKFVGFTGRIFEEDLMKLKDRGEREGKYVNTPETTIFNKSKLLYGFSVTKHAIRELDACVFVEGQMDFLVAYQAGIKNVVATSGTALTLEHLSLLKYLTKRLIFIFDADVAGQNATERAIALAQLSGLEPRVFTIKNGKDPGEYFLGKTARFDLLKDESLPAIDYFFQSLLPVDVLRQQSGDGLQKKLGAVRQFLQKVSTLASATERGHWMSVLADAARINIDDVRKDLEELIRSSAKDLEGVYVGDSHEKHFSRSSRLDLLFDEIITLVMYKPELSKHLVLLDGYGNGIHYNTFISLKGGDFAHKDVDPKLILMKSYLEASLGETMWEDELKRTIREYKLEYLRGCIQDKNSEIRSLEQAGNEIEMNKKVAEISSLLNDLRRVELDGQ